MLILVTGGSGSGKSAFAEQKAVSLAAGGELVYLATMQVYGEEGKKKVERHRQLRRGKGFETIERPVRVDRAEPGEDATVLLECIDVYKRQEYTLPGVSQTVIITRMEGRTPVPERERLRSLAAHGSTLVLFLSTGLLKQVREELLASGLSPDTPCAVCYKVTWEDEKILRGTVKQPVSYTHLDVYKRQRPSGSYRNARCWRFPAPKGKIPWRSPLPVSYTHLDVYKRQQDAQGKRRRKR